MYKAAVRWMIRRNVRALASGDPAPLLASYAHDAMAGFPRCSPLQVLRPGKTRTASWA